MCIPYYIEVVVVVVEENFQNEMTRIDDGIAVVQTLSLFLLPSISRYTHILE